MLRAGKKSDEAINRRTLYVCHFQIRGISSSHATALFLRGVSERSMSAMKSFHCFAQILSLAAIAPLSGCSSGPGSPTPALSSFSGERLLAHIRTLSSDEFEGRGPGSKGEQLTIRYLQDQFRSFGLEPGNPDGTYLQSVPLEGITADPGMKLALAGRGGTPAPKFQSDF